MHLRPYRPDTYTLLSVCYFAYCPICHIWQQEVFPCTSLTFKPNPLHRHCGSTLAGLINSKTKQIKVPDLVTTTCTNNEPQYLISLGLHVN